MYPLSDELAKGNFRGFTLKKGFWYGYDPDGVPVATSGWIMDDDLIIYQLAGEKWYKYALPVESCKELLPAEMLEALGLS